MKISLNVNTRKEIIFLFIMILSGYGWGEFIGGYSCGCGICCERIEGNF
jgi:hypothetical protein